MPVTLNSNPADRESQQCEPQAQCLTIGLINNMGDGALEATERQFLSLLESASEGVTVELSLYALPGVSRNEFGTSHIAKFYSGTETLWGKSLDGIIVTGREPLSPNLRDEPYWESFTKVLEWAKDNTYATVWSCLAAHAAALYMDGIGRVRSANKLFGVFDCQRVSDHPLAEGTSSSFRLPHSRWNGLPEDALKGSGYSILTRAADVGVDTFVKQDKSLFVFFQGHPEYESNTLLLEYRRDVGRFLRAESDTYPLMPQNYFDRDTSFALTALQQKVGTRPSDELSVEVSAILEKVSIENTWNPTATRIYRNWLQHISVRKQFEAGASEGSAGHVPAIAHIPPLTAAEYSGSATVFASNH